ncbi:MAG TPA: hypothetical protein VGI20_05740 [Rhizomicrobium sp.]
MRRFREFTGDLPAPLRLPVPRRLAFDGDLVVAEREKAEQEGPAESAEMAPMGMKVKNTSMPR